MGTLSLQREQLDEILFQALKTIFAFEQDKVNRFELSFEQIYLLQLLRRKSPSRMSEVASELGIPVSTASRVVDRLEKMKLVRRARDVKDKRVIYVSLSSNGRAAVQAVENHTFESLSRNLEEFSAEDIESFIKTARSLDRILSVQGNKSK